MNPQYDELLGFAADVDRKWCTANRDVDAFPDIVWNASYGRDFSAFGDIGKVPELLEIPAVAKLQEPSSFSDLHFVLFNNRHFQIEVLNWWGGEINIHDHDFSGIQFQLAGDSLNVLYGFDGNGTGSQLSTGELYVQDAELWRSGSRSYVRPGRSAPHKVTHLSLPTVSMIVRTCPSPIHGPQRNYFPPAISGSYSVATVPFRKRVAVLRNLSKGNVSDFASVFHFTFDHQTHTENLFTLLKLIDLIFEKRFVGLIEEYARQGDVPQSIVNAVAHYRASEILIHASKRVLGSDEGEKLGISAFASAWDDRSRNRIADALNGKGVKVAPSSSLHRLLDSTAEPYRDQLARAAQLLSLN